MKGSCLRVWRVVILLGVALTFSIAVSAQTEKIIYSFSNDSDGDLRKAWFQMAKISTELHPPGDRVAQ